MVQWPISSAAEVGGQTPQPALRATQRQSPCTASLNCPSISPCRPFRSQPTSQATHEPSLSQPVSFPRCHEVSLLALLGIVMARQGRLLPLPQTCRLSDRRQLLRREMEATGLGHNGQLWVGRSSWGLGESLCFLLCQRHHVSSHRTRCVSPHRGPHTSLWGGTCCLVPASPSAQADPAGPENNGTVHFKRDVRSAC